MPADVTIALLPEHREISVLGDKFPMQLTEGIFAALQGVSWDDQGRFRLEQ